MEVRPIDANAMTPETIIEIKRVFGRGGRLRTARTAVEVIRYSRLIDAPTLDYAPVRHGKWMWEGPFKACSICGTYIHATDTLGARFWKYCPNCGAKMDKEKENA